MFAFEISKYIYVLLLSMIKFVFGPVAGLAGGLHLLESTLLTILGMMSSVLVILFVGRKARTMIIRKFFYSRKKFTKNSRRFVKIWKRYGIGGVAFLTPLILTPIGGTLLVTAIGAPKFKVISYMLTSAVFWAFVVTKLVYLFGALIIT